MKGAVLTQINQSEMAALFLDRNFAMNVINWNNLSGSDQPSAYVTNLGGVFTSPPAATMPKFNRLDVFGLGTDYSVYHKTWTRDAAGHDQWTPDWEDLGGNFTCTPVVTSSGAKRIDLFGLGADQTLIHRAWNGSAWSAWDILGGAFTSPPVVLPGATTGTFDIIGRGLDFLIYHTTWKPGGSADWTPIGGGLLGEPVAMSAPAAVRARQNVFVSVTGLDGAIWFTLFDGAQWRPWSSLGVVLTPEAGYQQGLGGGISFVSEPVATTFFAVSPIVEPGGGGSGTVNTDGGPPPAYAQPPGPLGSAIRIDVFGVGTYNDFLKQSSLWHKWLDGKGWHGALDANGKDTGQWERIDGSFACAPSILAPNRAKTQFAMPPAEFFFVGPNPDGFLHSLEFTNGAWTKFVPGPSFRLPSYISVSLDKMEIDNTRSVHNDTDLVWSSYTAGKWPTQQDTSNQGDVNNGTYPFYNMKFGPIPTELCEPLIFVYMIVNSGNSDTVSSVFAAMQKGGEDYVNDLLKSIVNPDSNTVVGVTEVLVDAGGGPILVGSLLGAAAGVVLDSFLNLLYGLIFKDCDGVVANETIAFRTARDLQTLIRGQGVNAVYSPPATVHHNPDAPSGCRHSLYKTFWSASEVELPLPTD
jgi:hypothetical protein